MLINYFKTGWRNLMRSKGYSFINILGLASGMAIALVIGLFIWDELSFNKYHKNYFRLGRIMATQTFNDETSTAHTTVVPLEQELRTKYKGDFSRLSLTWAGTNILAVGNKKISRTGRWAQPDFPEMFTLEMLSGTRHSFNDPSSILLSASVAEALFGKEDPLNQTIKVDNKTDMKVTGVFKDLPRNSTLFETQFLLPWYNKANWWNTQSGVWSNHGCELFVQLTDHANPRQVSEKIKKITQEHGYTASNELLQVHEMSKWHLYSEFENGVQSGGRIRTVWLFGIIGAFVLLLACINFMNLSTARSEKRAKEVGIRKAIGSLRPQLIRQFLSESILVAFMALAVSLFITATSLSLFNDIAGKDMTIPWNAPFFWIILIVFSFITGIISGSYPAFYLSSFEPVKVLKGTYKAGRFASLPRKVLVVLQFTVSIALIIGTAIVFRQIQHAAERPVGYNRNGLLTVVMNTPELYANYNALRTELLESGAVYDMTESNSPPTQIWSNNNGFEWSGKDPASDPLFGTIAVTHDYGRTVGWQLTQGRDFSRDHVTDSTAFILNESAVKISGLKDPIGKTMTWNGKEHTIVGVVKDMVMESPYRPTVPTIFLVDYGWLNVIIIRIMPSMATKTALVKMEEVFKKFNPGSPFEYKFADDEYARKFSDEQRMGQLAAVFAILAVFISCLGLFGLASFVAEQRTKEIGVRKVLGATTFNLWRLLSKDFLLLVVIALLIAMPFTWYLMHRWLQHYTYRANISWWIFAAAGLVAIMITILTVSFQAIRAALMNPVKTLRTE